MKKDKVSLDTSDEDVLTDSVKVGDKNVPDGISNGEVMEDAVDAEEVSVDAEDVCKLLALAEECLKISVEVVEV